MTFDFGIVNYNGGAALLECVASILRLDGPPAGVTIFDNASTDGSPDEAAKRFPAVTVMRSDQNLGYAGALNRMLRAMTADVVVLCNMDLQFDPAWTRVVSDALRQNPDVDSLASLVVELTEPPVVNSAGIRFYPDLHPQNVGSGVLYEPGVLTGHDVVSAYGAVMCFRRSAVQDIDFDEDYFLFFEETDFFLRFTLLGHRIRFVPDAVVYHHRSLTTRRYSPLKLYYGERNRLTTVFKLLPAWYWPLTFVYSIRRLNALRGQSPRDVGAGAATEFPHPLAIIWTIGRAWLHAVARLPSTLRKRSAFWRTTRAGPVDTLRLIRRHRLDDSELRLR